jgi:hypothetical protein
MTIGAQLLLRLAIIHQALDHYQDLLDGVTLSPRERLLCQVMVEEIHAWADELTPPLTEEPDELV